MWAALRVWLKNGIWSSKSKEIHSKKPQWKRTRVYRATYTFRIANQEVFLLWTARLLTWDIAHHVRCPKSWTGSVVCCCRIAHLVISTSGYSSQNAADELGITDRVLLIFARTSRTVWDNISQECNPAQIERVQRRSLHPKAEGTNSYLIILYFPHPPLPLLSTEDLLPTASISAILVNWVMSWAPANPFSPPRPATPYSGLNRLFPFGSRGWSSGAGDGCPRRPLSEPKKTVKRMVVRIVEIMTWISMRYMTSRLEWEEEKGLALRLLHIESMTVNSYIVVLWDDFWMKLKLLLGVVPRSNIYIEGRKDVESLTRVWEREQNKTKERVASTLR